MGVKGDSQTGAGALEVELLCEKLVLIDGITSKKMFGGFGVFCDNKMFAMVDSKGNSFLKADDSIKTDFEKEGAIKHGKMPYYSIPETIKNDPELLVNWAKKSIALTK